MSALSMYTGLRKSLTSKRQQKKQRKTLPTSRIVINVPYAEKQTLSILILSFDIAHAATATIAFVQIISTTIFTFYKGRFKFELIQAYEVMCHSLSLRETAR